MAEGKRIELGYTIKIINLVRVVKMKKGV